MRSVRGRNTYRLFVTSGTKKGGFCRRLLGWDATPMHRGKTEEVAKEHILKKISHNNLNFAFLLSSSSTAVLEERTELPLSMRKVRI